MKIHMLILGICVAMFLSGCSPSGDIKMNIEKKTDAFNVTQGVIKAGSKDTFRGHDQVSYIFYLSNFDMKAGNDNADRYGPDLKSKDQKKIIFNLVAIDLEQGFGTKLREGVYSASSAAVKDSTPGLELGSFRVYYFDTAEQVFARLGGNKDSWVNIASIKGDTVEGEVHFIDGEDKIEGKFTAKMAKESGS